MTAKKSTNDCQNEPSAASLEQVPTRAELEAMTYEQWLDYHRNQPGGWLSTAAPEDLLRACYVQRLTTFDAMKDDEDA